ncbi:MAG: hypothetical protein J6J24_02320 [Clostridia bacterium]|nr:hypothetical protein [Clostridia bacterium]
MINESLFEEAWQSFVKKIQTSRYKTAGRKTLIVKKSSGYYSNNAEYYSCGTDVNNGVADAICVENAEGFRDEKRKILFRDYITKQALKNYFEDEENFKNEMKTVREKCAHLYVEINDLTKRYGGLFADDAEEGWFVDDMEDSVGWGDIKDKYFILKENYEDVSQEFKNLRQREHFLKSLLKLMNLKKGRC